MSWPTLFQLHSAGGGIVVVSCVSDMFVCCYCAQLALQIVPLCTVCVLLTSPGSDIGESASASLQALSAFEWPWLCRHYVAQLKQLNTVSTKLAPVSMCVGHKVQAKTASLNLTDSLASL